MDQTSHILQGLRTSLKGKLKYDPTWYENGKLKEVLNECSSPPTIGFKSPPKQNVNTIPDHNKSKEDMDISVVKEDSTSADRSAETPVKEKHRSEVITLENVTSQNVISPEVIRSELVIREYENDFRNKAKDNAENRRKLFNTHSSKLGQQAEADLVQLYLRQETISNRQLQKALEENLARQKIMESKNNQMKEQHQRHAAMLHTKMREAEKQRLQLEEANKQRLQARQGQLDQIASMHVEVVKVGEDIQNKIKQCQHPKYLPENIMKYPDLIAQVAQYLQNNLKEMQHNESAELSVSIKSDLVARAKSFYDVVKQAVDGANSKGQTETADAAKVAAAAQAKAAAASAQAAVQAASLASASTGGSSDVVLCVSDEAFNIYQRLQAAFKQLEAQCEALVADVKFKKYRFELQKAINLPVNSISATSGSHLMEKLQRLCKLFSGNTVQVNDRSVCAKDHPAAIPFCKQLFTKKIVKQGDEQISSSYDSAFAYAAVVTGVWGLFPDVGDLFLAEFHAKCPYIVPYYIPPQEGQSKEDHYSSLGYKYKDGKIEDQDKFLKRMSGIMRLYASILVAPPPRGAHPHGIENAWRWLAEVMNLEPRPDITATMTYDMLQVTGSSLHKTYGKQFVKLVQTFQVHFIPKLRKVTPEGSGGPVTRLDSFLGEIMKKGINPPKGFLSANFWFT